MILDGSAVKWSGSGQIEIESSSGFFRRNKSGMNSGFWQVFVPRLVLNFSIVSIVVVVKIVLNVVIIIIIVVGVIINVVVVVKVVVDVVVVVKVVVDVVVVVVVVRVYVDFETFVERSVAVIPSRSEGIQEFGYFLGDPPKTHNGYIVNKYIKYVFKLK
jgi:hypothetical protein